MSPDGKRTVLIGDSELTIQPSPGLPGTPYVLPVTGIPLWPKDGPLIVVIDTRQRGSSQAVTELIRREGISDLIRVLPAAAPPTSPPQKPDSTGRDAPLAAGLTPDGRTVVVVNSYGDIVVQDADTAQRRDAVTGVADVKLILDAAVSASADVIAMVKMKSTDPRGSVVMYDLRNRRTIGSIPGDDVTHVRFIGGQRLLVQRKSGNLEVWDERGTTLSRIIRGDPAYYEAPVADHEGKLAARLRDQTAIDIVDLDTGTSLEAIPPFPEGVKAGYAFAHDGEVVATAIDRDEQHNAKLVVRDFSPQALLASACAAAGSNLSADEWRSVTGAIPTAVATC